MKPSHFLGRMGEQLAARYLQNKGYTILERNWLCRAGELDIVARHNDQLVIVEVRTRSAGLPEAAFASITPRKREKLIRATNVYLSEFHLSECQWRIDVIAIALPKHGEPLIEHAEDALNW